MNRPRRGETFVTRKITRGLNMILKGERDTLVDGIILSPIVIVTMQNTC